MTSIYIYQGIHVRILAFMKATGIVTYISAYLIKSLLEERCGSSAYEHCFELCPLPDAASFNHNSLYHILTTVGIIVHIIAEVKVPSSSMFPVAYDENDSSQNTIDKSNSQRHRTMNEQNFISAQKTDLESQNSEVFEENDGNFTKWRR
eukprot:CAMPEP_0203679946 /NCGR_PEP_ID=MMETSP0090-20130426/37579_1 /ASSEMBLY_ACC=CAM_ASM_001088 /TAXON_ID=426623 /ORGANISM="Chaetoceros affinis, Strain CCMP159" /LENGTH=148 /DNA_ID=CAMNT_0050547797 /DNA_START=485 /DNA_END=931 /DNA_ORIENTATION=-